MRLFGPALVALSLTAGCGYHMSGHADLLPKSIHTIAVPAFSNNTIRYRLTDSLPEAISKEFILRTRYSITPDAKAADAVLQGSVISYSAIPTVYDAIGGRASAVQLMVTLQLVLRDRNGKALFERPSMEVRERYEISGDARAYFEESDVALARMSRDVARSVVSAILENF
ncbi:MAG: LptE family protein [Bryobacterales bacterium]|nr:LptE family protein [Bryobacterales bacterium]